MSYNIVMVSLQEQLDLALALARSNEHARIGIVADAEEFKALNINLEDGEAYCAQTRSVQVANGAVVKWIDPNPENVVSGYCGSMFTTLFVGKEVSSKTVSYLQTRLRSSKFKGNLKTYYHHGHVMWETWEQYGG